MAEVFGLSTHGFRFGVSDCRPKIYEYVILTCEPKLGPCISYYYY